MDLKEYVRRCGESANKKGWLINWENLPAYLMATMAELTEGFEEGWRDDKPNRMAEEVGDCLIRLFHLCHDLKIDIESILQSLMEENEKRSYKHGHKRI